MLLGRTVLTFTSPTLLAAKAIAEERPAEVLLLICSKDSEVTFIGRIIVWHTETIALGHGVISTSLRDSLRVGYHQRLSYYLDEMNSYTSKTIVFRTVMRVPVSYCFITAAAANNGCIL